MTIIMKALIILANGFEEIEAMTVADILKRANITTTLASISSSVVEGAHGIKVVADKGLADVRTDDYDILILPGGSPGYKNLANSSSVINLIKSFDQRKRLIAAICAAPVVLAKAGVIDDKIVTVYPGMENQVPKPRDAKVVVNGNIITSKAPGTSIEFGLKIVEVLSGKKISEKIREELVA